MSQKNVEVVRLVIEAINARNPGPVHKLFVAGGEWRPILTAGATSKAVMSRLEGARAGFRSISRSGASSRCAADISFVELRIAAALGVGSG